MARTKWTEDEIQFIKDNYLEMSDKDMAAHFQGHTEFSVANKRKRLGLKKSNRKYTFEDVKKEFGKTDYILLSDEKDYIDSATNSLKYICSKHEDKGIQTISLGHLQSGRGCYYCGWEVTEAAHRIDPEENKLFCEQLCESKGFEFVDVIKIENIWHIKYICKNHRDKGIQIMRKGNMTRDFIIGCPYCFQKSNISKGEKTIADILTEWNINFIPQFRFEDCKDILTLPFDYYLPDNNMCIEYDGEGHYLPIQFNRSSPEQAEASYKSTIKHDQIKNEYCASNNISLIRIPYYDFKNIETILYKELIA